MMHADGTFEVKVAGHAMKSLIAALLACTAACAIGAELDVDTACLDCHRPGQTRGEVPLIEGQQRDYLLHQLERFRDRHREGFPMSSLISGLDDATVERIADALSRRPWRSASDAVMQASVARGRERAASLACDTCHVGQYNGSGDIPRLAGQQPGYLRRQVAAFGEGERYHPPTGVGARMYALSAQDAEDVAAFLHSLAPASAPEP